MKRIAVLLAACLITITSFAQVSVSSGTPNIDVKLKRCFASGNDVYIDLVLNGNGRWENVYINGYESRIYDDEGNMYKGGFMGGQDYRYGISFEYDKLSNKPNCQINIPRDIPRKVRLKITDVDEYASALVKISLPCDGNSTNANPFEITIKNLPITRE